ncbi:dihydrofolate reductase family protein [Specibacter cremeus]|uniref:dihydrofolate reductase family protein n=1 Tax=Specibacter cremeus TaxID=1629051 RepID=UPI001F0C7D7E|nr:dihydrofolate reductase family protein [Specibacter cremeus]
MNNVTLDGVMQAPGRPDEDTRGGFGHGGWAGPYNDPVMGEYMAKGMASGADLLFGRRTWEDFSRVWPNQPGNPFSELLDRVRKFVASRTLVEPLGWQNSVLLAGDAAQSVAALKQTDGPDLVVLGSGDLLQTLLRAGLVDTMTLSIHPLVLGEGRKLFTDELARTALRLEDSVVTTTGVVIATYTPV